MKNKGISLITLVITIIIMIILAGAIILTLTNSGIFDKATESTDTYSLKQVQAIADLAWSEAYADNKRDKDSLQIAVDDALKANGLEGKYTAIADEKGVTVSKIGDQGNGGQGGTANVPTDWQNSVVAIVDGVPIPKGFVASPYDGTDGMPAENTKAGGLVIYALNEGETSATDIRVVDGEKLTDAKEIHYKSMETRNQFVWVPVDKENFATEFVRDGFGNHDDKISDTITSDYKYWELALKDDNTPSETQNSRFVSDVTLTEAKAMYESVKEYGGFYIARYEVGTDIIRTWNGPTGNVSITMGKYPYNYVKWSDTMRETANDGGAVALSRAFYPNNSDNTTGVVSTLTYGVQWDATLNWWTGKDLTNSTSYGNYYNRTISSDEYNANAKYSANSGSSWEDAVEKIYDEEIDDGNRWILTTGAFKNANVNNIYDMAGNLYEWTMEGYSSNNRGYRGGGFINYGYNNSVIFRCYGDPDGEIDMRRFPPRTLHKVAQVTCVAGTKTFAKMNA